MKILFLLDTADENGKIVEQNVRAVESTPDKLTLQQTDEFLTWLCTPIVVTEPGKEPETRFLKLMSFPIAIKTKPLAAPIAPPKLEVNATPVPAGTVPDPSAAEVKVVNKKSKAKGKKATKKGK